ncbi:hypothetical protein [Gordonia crocea]|uniref:ESX-1 secretion-associated protein EspA/EspE-like domain-containing protein n=1 Tax=Gordonia crocea TaxID=589162 RepID=A0A7I9UY38_9ACTN|nr:hypothetical protein [Gordonia crocea]GED98015.1 hypothetical protein nbrc107697_20540 [Gordonia crocea]
MLAQLEQIINDLRRRLEQLIEQIEDIRRTFEEVANRFLIRVILRISQAVISAAERFMEAVSRVAKWIAEHLKWVQAPFFLLKVPDDWSAISKKAGKTAGGMKDPEITLASHWEGMAWVKYDRVRSDQNNATKGIGSVARNIQDGAQSTGAAGAVFYSAVLVAAAQLVVEVTAEVAAACSGVGAIPAAAAGCLTAMKCMTIMMTAVVALQTFLLTKKGDTRSLRSEFQDESDYPGGQWPPATTRGYSDATVTDGTNRWSVY